MSSMWHLSERLLGPNFICPGLRCPYRTGGGGKVPTNMSVPCAQGRRWEAARDGWGWWH